MNYGTVSLYASTCADNNAMGGGGMLESGGDGAFGGFAAGGAVANQGYLSLSNCTFSGNHAIGGNTFDHGGHAAGGALWTAGTNAYANVSSCTISNNDCVGGHGGAGHFDQPGDAHGGGVFTEMELIQFPMKNTIIAGNQAVAVREDSAVSGNDVLGAVDSQGFNLIGDARDSSRWVAADLIGPVGNEPVDARLGPLRDNGGATPTMALLPDSPALDRGFLGGVDLIDQRGFPRPVNIAATANHPGGDGADIGAFEVQARVLDIGLRAFDGYDTYRIACEVPEQGGVLTSPMRIHKNGTDYGVVLTELNTTNATRLRIQTPSGLKALEYLP
jgi:hypothetical protein